MCSNVTTHRRMHHHKASLLTRPNVSLGVRVDFELHYDGSHGKQMLNKPCKMSIDCPNESYAVHAGEVLAWLRCTFNDVPGTKSLRALTAHAEAERKFSRAITNSIVLSCQSFANAAEVSPKKASCWKSLFRGAVLALGFPIARRDDLMSSAHVAQSSMGSGLGVEVGHHIVPRYGSRFRHAYILQILFEAMLDLVCVQYPLEFDNRIILRGVKVCREQCPPFCTPLRS